jgi:dTDP-glucose pyrophosphorylase/predicted transcriptional regulator
MSKLEKVIIDKAASIKQSMKQLSENSMQILLVTDPSNRLIGTITDGDIRRGLLNGLNFDESITKVMHTDFISLRTNTRDMKREAMKLMTEYRIEQIPILDENNRVTDIILWTDLFETCEIKDQERLPNQVIIMAGGEGTRLDPFTKVLPKALIPIGNRPVIELIMERFFDCGFSQFIYTLNYKKEYLKLFLREHDLPYSIRWVEEEDYLGTAGSIGLLKNKIKDTFFVANCDSLLDVNFQEVLEWHREHDAAITIVGCHNEVKIPFGVQQLDKGKLTKISEKPVQDVIINTGVYVMQPSVASYIPEGKKMDMNELIEAVAEENKISVYPIYSGWIDLGRWKEYRKTLKQLGDS